MELELSLKLEMDCYVCDADGKMYDEDKDRIERCWKCEGKGTVLTNGGQAVLDFIGKYK